MPETVEGPQNPGRRRFLKQLLGLAAVGVIGSGPVVQSLQKKQEAPTSISRSPLPRTPEQTPVAPVYIPIEKETVPEKYIWNEKLFFTSEVKEIEIAGQMVKRQVENYERMEPEEFKKRIKDSLRWKSKVLEIARKQGFRPESKVPGLVPALIFVESGGDPDKVGGYKDKKTALGAKDFVSARGLCQVKPETVDQIAKEQKIKMNNETLFNPDMNITFALEHLNHLHKTFPDLGLTFWAYHFGEGNVTNAIRTYLVNDKDFLTSGQVDDVLRDEKMGTPLLVKEFGLSFIKLVTSPEVRRFFGLDKNDEYKMERLNDTEFYVPRIGAAVDIFVEAPRANSPRILRPSA